MNLSIRSIAVRFSAALALALGFAATAWADQGPGFRWSSHAGKPGGASRTGPSLTPYRYSSPAPQARGPVYSAPVARWSRPLPAASTPGPVVRYYYPTVPGTVVYPSTTAAAAPPVVTYPFSPSPVYMVPGR